MLTEGVWSVGSVLTQTLHRSPDVVQDSPQLHLGAGRDLAGSGTWSGRRGEPRVEAVTLAEGRDQAWEEAWGSRTTTRVEAVLRGKQRTLGNVVGERLVWVCVVAMVTKVGRGIL